MTLLLIGQVTPIEVCLWPSKKFDRWQWLDMECWRLPKAVFRTLGTVRFFCLPDPDPFVKGTVRIQIRIWMVPYPITQNSKKNLDFFAFLISLWLCIFEEWCKCYFKKYDKKYSAKKLTKKIFCCVLKVTDEKSRIWSWTGSESNVTDREHCLKAC